MQRACFLRWFLSDLCITAMALNEEGTATPGKQIQEDDEMQRYSGEEIKGDVQIPEHPCLERVRDASAVFTDFFTRVFRHLI